MCYNEASVLIQAGGGRMQRLLDRLNTNARGRIYGRNMYSSARERWCASMG